MLRKRNYLMIDEYIEFNEYTTNLIPKFGENSRLLNNSKKMPNLLRPYDIIFRYGFQYCEASEKDRVDKAFKLVKSWVEGTKEDYNQLGKNNFAKLKVFSDKHQVGYFRDWFDRYADSSLKKRFKGRDLEVLPKYDQTYREYDTVNSLIRRLTRSAIRKNHLRRNVSIFFPIEILKEIKERCLKSWPTESAAFITGVVMLLGFYKAEKERSNDDVRFLIEDFQNWTGVKKYEDNYWHKDTKKGSLGFDGTEIFEFNMDQVSRITYITNVNIDIEKIEYRENDNSYFASTFIPNKGLYLIDRGRGQTYEKLCDIFKDIFRNKTL